MALQFPKQLRRSGFKKPIIGGGTSYDEFILPFMGDEVIGDVSALQYSAPRSRRQKNEEFVKAYRKKYSKVPSYYSEGYYTTAQIIDEAIKKAGGKYPGPAKFVEIMGGLKIDAVRGPVTFEDRNPVENIYIKKVDEEEDVRLSEGRAVERRDQDLPECQPVLDLREGEVLEAAGLQPQLPAVQVLRISRRTTPGPATGPRHLPSMRGPSV